MKTPLFFKLLLMLALGLRLIYAARKSRKREAVSYYSMKTYEDKPLVIPEGIDPNQPVAEQLKFIYRKAVRGQMDSQTKVLVFLAVELEKTLQKGKLFRFIWHRNKWVIVFYEALQKMGFTDQSIQYSRALFELTETDLTRTEAADLDPEALFPHGEKDSPGWKAFEASFNLKEFQNSVMWLVKTSI